MTVWFVNGARWRRGEQGPYLVLFVSILTLEALIACHLHDPLIRPYGGDALAVVLVYALLRAVTPSSRRLPERRMRIALSPALLSLALLCLVEIVQYYRGLERLGLARQTVLRVVLGTTFDWLDLAAYLAGFTAIFVMERLSAFPRGA